MVKAKIYRRRDLETSLWVCLEFTMGTMRYNFLMPRNADWKWMLLQARHERYRFYKMYLDFLIPKHVKDFRR